MVEFPNSHDLNFPSCAAGRVFGIIVRVRTESEKCR